MRTPPLPRTLRARLTTGLVVLLATAYLAVGGTTVLALEGFLVRRLDVQLTVEHGRFAAGMEHDRRLDDPGDTRGEADDTFGALLRPGGPDQAAVVRDGASARVPLTPRDRALLAAVPANGTGHPVRLSAIGAYQVVAVPG